MAIYSRIKQDHEKQRRLAASLVETSGDTSERRTLWEDFKSEVEAHAAAEEQTFYAALIEKPESQEQARHSVSEHKETSDLIKELTEMDMASSGWLNKFHKLKEELEHHLDEEEEDVFPLARKVIDDAKAEQLATDFDRRKAAE